MKIGIIGAGAMSDALGTKWTASGHNIFIGSRTIDKARALAEKIGHGAKSGSIAESAKYGDVVLLAVHHEAVMDALREAKADAGSLAGKVIIDCNNPVEIENFTIRSEYITKSMAEQIAESAPGSQVIKAFNMCQAKVWEMTPPVFDGRPLSVLFCGDDSSAKAVVAELISDIGCNPVDIGPLFRARLLEPAAAIVIYLLFNGYNPYTVLNLIVADEVEKN